MISVIMPTMWRGAHYKNMLRAFNDHPLVGEIIIIDNDTEMTDHSILTLSKVKHFPQKENIYVNPAWNLGVKLAQYDQLCLYSDDGLFNVSILDTMSKAITSSNGMFGISVDCYLFYDPHLTDLIDDGSSVRLNPINTFVNNPGYGTCLFVHKDSYHEIPDKLKIYWGDVYLFRKNVIDGKQNYEICDIQIISKISTTSSQPQFKQTLHDDTVTFEVEIAPTLLENGGQNMEDYLKEFYQDLKAISKEITFDNVINDDGDPYPLNPESYKGKVYLELKDKLEGFDDYLFIEYDQSAVVKHELPATRFYPHDKKVLICNSGEAKFQSMYEIKKEFHHVFANYYWDEESVTSLPLGYFAYHEDNYIPSKERLHNIHFVACLNKHRVALASALTKIPQWLVFLGMHIRREKTLKWLNAFAKLFPGNTIQFNHEFNAGLNSQTYCNTLRNTKIVLAPRGWINSETFRMYEAMQYGCVVFCDKLPDREYYKDIPVIQVDNWKDGLKKAKDLLKDQEYLTYLSEKHRQFYEEKLSPQATAKIIINALKNK